MGAKLPNTQMLNTPHDFTDKDGNDTMQQQIDANYYRIKNEVRQIVADEIERIKADPELSHLIKDK